MKLSTTILVAGLALLGGGCSSLRPPSQDGETWHAEQSLEAAKQGTDATGQTLLAGYELGMLGYFLYDVAK